MYEAMKAGIAATACSVLMAIVLLAMIPAVIYL
jgi:hypothetical protein